MLMEKLKGLENRNTGQVGSCVEQVEGSGKGFVSRADGVTFRGQRKVAQSLERLVAMAEVLEEKIWSYVFQAEVNEYTFRVFLDAYIRVLEQIKECVEFLEKRFWA